MQYLEIEDCYAGFAFIKKALTSFEPAPDYKSDQEGMAELKKVLYFVQQDEYYPTFVEKTAYIIYGIAGSQYFQNGNKRLAITMLLQFLIKNRVIIRQLDDNQFEELLKAVFPLHHWENNEHITDPHANFLYNLAMIIGDRNVWGVSGSKSLQAVLGKIFELLYIQN